MKISAGLLVTVDHGVDRFMTQSPMAFPDHPATDLFSTPSFLAQLRKVTADQRPDHFFELSMVAVGLAMRA